jgi:hypothetical protein
VKVAGKFELLFVNDFGLPFNTGNLVYAVLLIGLIVWGLMWTQRAGVVLNTVILGVSVILVGYSTYAMIVVRSTANPPIDENNPENVFNLRELPEPRTVRRPPPADRPFWDSPEQRARRTATPCTPPPTR